MTTSFVILGEPASTRITFIYALTDPNGDIRYVGKSDRPLRRFEVHLCDTGDTHKGRWVRLLRERGDRPQLKILQVVKFADWQQFEREWIRRAEAAGAVLTNSTAGGRGPLEPSLETRERMRQRKLGIPLKPEHCRKVSAALKGRRKPPRSNVHKAALSVSCMGRAISRDHVEKLRSANRALPARNPLGLKGVYFDRQRNRYQAHIKVNKKMIFLGRHETAEQAARAYNAAALAHGWPIAGLNPV